MLKRWLIGWIIGQNVQRVLIVAVFALGDISEPCNKNCCANVQQYCTGPIHSCTYCCTSTSQKSSSWTNVVVIHQPALHLVHYLPALCTMVHKGTYILRSRHHPQHFQFLVHGSHGTCRKRTLFTHIWWATKYGNSLVHNIHANQGSQCTDVHFGSFGGLIRWYTWSYHGVISYHLDGAQWDVSLDEVHCFEWPVRAGYNLM